MNQLKEIGNVIDEYAMALIKLNELKNLEMALKNK